MSQIKNILITTHVVFRKKTPIEPVEGPFSEDAEALERINKKIEMLQIPLSGFTDPVLYGNWKPKKILKLPKFLGVLAPVKYLVDLIICGVYTTGYVVKHGPESSVVIGIDPLACLSPSLLKKFFNFKLIYHCVDFNKKRFSNKILQGLYEKADELCTRSADQTWVICESLREYKDKIYGCKSYYVPHAPIFDDRLFKSEVGRRTGNKMAWTGALLTDRLFDILFGVLRTIQNEIHPGMEFYFAPTRDHEKLSAYGQKYGLKEFRVLDLHSRREWQEFAATCDVGIALYDENFGSTEFIEPLKIWDFLLCGLPFIVSGEPSVSQPIRESGTAYFLKPHNEIPKDGTLEKFLRPDNLRYKAPICLKLVEEFDLSKQIARHLNDL
ncbi:MAG: hypothetical protein M1352_03055 [Patescibacteria group bacterium]|nr:hypothetical protein [Patescibacteria group bacterium]